MVFLCQEVHLLEKPDWSDLESVPLRISFTLAIFVSLSHQSLTKISAEFSESLLLHSGEEKAVSRVRNQKKKKKKKPEAKGVWGPAK